MIDNKQDLFYYTIKRINVKLITMPWYRIIDNFPSK